jgi:SAM-dependent methyltransferase
MNVNHTPKVFDQALIRQHRARAAQNFEQHRVLFDESSALLTERLGDVKRPFGSILDLGSRDEFFCKILADRYKAAVVSTTLNAPINDDEMLRFAPTSFDLVLSNLHLHWVNDLPGMLAQIKEILKPDGLFLASLLGGSTLYELRSCLMDAEIAVKGGVSPRLSPVIDLPMATTLLQRVGFAVPVIDQETITMMYPDMFALMLDLRGMGETNANVQRLRQPTRRTVFSLAARLYQERFGDKNGHIPATFELIFMHGWSS